MLYNILKIRKSLFGWYKLEDSPAVNIQCLSNQISMFLLVVAATFFGCRQTVVYDDYFIDKLKI